MFKSYLDLSEPKNAHIRLAVKSKEVTELHQMLNISRSEISSLLESERQLQLEVFELRESNSNLRLIALIAGTAFILDLKTKNRFQPIKKTKKKLLNLNFLNFLYFQKKYFLSAQCDSHESEIRSALSEQNRILNEKYQQLETDFKNYEETCEKKFEILREQK